VEKVGAASITPPPCTKLIVVGDPCPDDERQSLPAPEFVRSQFARTPITAFTSSNGKYQTAGAFIVYRTDAKFGV